MNEPEERNGGIAWRLRELERRVIALEQQKLESRIDVVASQITGLRGDARDIKDELVNLKRIALGLIGTLLTGAVLLVLSGGLPS